MGYIHIDKSFGKYLKLNDSQISYNKKSFCSELFEIETDDQVIKTSIKNWDCVKKVFLIEPFQENCLILTFNVIYPPEINSNIIKFYSKSSSTEIKSVEEFINTKSDFSRFILKNIRDDKLNQLIY